jgi:hypothetical protein
MQHPPPVPRPSIAAIDAAIALAILVAAAPAHAQSAEAEALFQQGNRLMAEVRLAEACDAFEASRKIEPLAGTLIRLAQCREANHQLASAWSAYKDALARARDPRKRELASAGYRRLESQLSRLTIEVADDVRIDGLVISRSASPLDPTQWNTPVPVDGGELVIAAHAPGHVEWQTPVRVPEASGAVTIKIPRLGDLPPRLPPPRPAPPRPASAPPRAPSSSPWTLPRKLSIAAGGVSLAAVATGVVLGIQARRLEREAFRACPEPVAPCDDAAAAQATLDRSHRRALYANIGFGAGAVAAAAAVALWLIAAPGAPGPPGEPGVAVVPAISSTATGLALTGRF